MPATAAPVLPVTDRQEAAAHALLSSLGVTGCGAPMGFLFPSDTAPGCLRWLPGRSAPVRKVVAGLRALGLVVRRRPGDWLVGAPASA